MLLKLWIFTILYNLPCNAEVPTLRSFHVNQTVLAFQDQAHNSEGNQSGSYNVRKSNTKCSDRYYSDCRTRIPFESLNVDFELCLTVCKAYHHPISCDWLVYDQLADHKCEMFSNMGGSMEAFFDSCVVVGGPTKHADGRCMVDSSPEECPSHCEQGCKGCDPESLPCEQIHDVECNLDQGLPADEPAKVYSFDVCKTTCAGLNHPFARWDSTSQHSCTCWTTGERKCKKMAVSVTATIASSSKPDTI